jgi:RNA polymerase sigma factor (TIGR02999 family)
MRREWSLPACHFSSSMGVPQRRTGVGEATQILKRIEAGDTAASAQLLPLVYEELRKLASVRIAAESSNNTLNATALVHEAYLRLVGPSDEARWDNRGHFFAAAAEAMRRLLVEHARQRKRQKRGGGQQQISLEAADAGFEPPSEDLVALDEALTRLAALDSLKAEVVQLRFFGGLTMPEIARTLDLSLSTVERHWTFARAWLFAELSENET